jgi:hypothetical protein
MNFMGAGARLTRSSYLYTGWLSLHSGVHRAPSPEALIVSVIALNRAPSDS